jgi:hypothetical protein
MIESLARAKVGPLGAKFILIHQGEVNPKPEKLMEPRKMM